jgi:hypothetical protein
MRKSKHIQLVLITALLAACGKNHEKQWGDDEKKVYMRSDTTARYTHTSSPLLWYFAFRSFGMFGSNGSYSRGYFNGGLSPQSNFGSNGSKRNASRGGFGRSSSRVSS